MRQSMLHKVGTISMTFVACVATFGELGCSIGPATPGTSAATASGASVQQVPSDPTQKRYSSAEQAAAELKDAVLTRNRGMLIEILGVEGRQLVLTGDRIEEKNDMEAFGQHLTENLRVDYPTASKAVLYIGRENWPFPIPVVKTGSEWVFDTAAGKEELLNRRIGENELNAIAVCGAYVAAQKEYARRDRMGETITQYAQHFRSSEGKKDGLYWTVSPGEPLSPMGPLIVEAQEEGYLTKPPDGKPHPYHGYYFHILTAQGEAAPGGKMSYLVEGHLTKGFAMIASPSAWDASGVMTFQVNQSGKIYQKNLGPQTRELVKAITEYNPDQTWEEVKE